MTQDEKLDMLLRMAQRIADEVGEVRTRLDVLEGSGQASGPEAPARREHREPGWWETWQDTHWWETWRETLESGESSPGTDITG